MLLARKEHGKSTLLLEGIPGLLRARTRGLDLGVWPFDRRPTLHIRDPKMQLQRELKTKIPPGWRMQTYETAYGLAMATRDCDPLDVAILEELMTVPRSEFSAIDAAVSMSRRDTSSEGPIIWATTQRPVHLPVNLRALPDRWLVGKITEPDDLKAMSQVAGQDILSISPRLETMEFHEVKI